MNILITGATGQLGRTLMRTVPQMIAGEQVHLSVVARDQVDLTDQIACRKLIEEKKPDWLINAAAYTAVDQAEIESDLAIAVNASAPNTFASVLAEQRGKMLHLSTDYVFSGHHGFPYSPDQPVKPLSVYGSTKAQGEKAVLNHLGNDGLGYVLRTSWLYGPIGKNFLVTMLKLHHEREYIKVVSDQVSCATSTSSLAKACWRLLEASCHGEKLPPILHWSDAGVCSWYDFALAIGEIAQELQLLAKTADVFPISTAEYASPSSALRPSYSLLDTTLSRACLGFNPRHWRHELFMTMQQISNDLSI